MYLRCGPPYCDSMASPSRVIRQNLVSDVGIE
jgi:hypothetical protein